MALQDASQWGYGEPQEEKEAYQDPTMGSMNASGFSLDSPIVKQAVADSGGKLSLEVISSYMPTITQAAQQGVPLETVIIDPTIRAALQEIYDEQVRLNSTSLEAQKEAEEAQAANEKAATELVMGGSILALLSGGSKDSILAMPDDKKADAVGMGHVCLDCGGEMDMAANFSITDIFDRGAQQTPATGIPSRSAGVGV